MKILQLKLLAFGPFTNAQYDLSPGQEGLHILYGPNEAGKSSTLRAITDSFFGIPAAPRRTIFFIVTLRCESERRLRSHDQTEIELIRRKANQNPLRLGDDVTPVDADDAMRQLLGDVGPYCVSRPVRSQSRPPASRRRGNRQGSGRIGEILFAAGAGLAQLRQVKNQLQEESNKLLKTTGRSGSILAGIKELKDHRSAVREAQIPEDHWRSHDAQLQTAKAGKEAIDLKIRQQVSGHNRLVRVRDAQPVIAHWQRALEELRAHLRRPPLAAGIRRRLPRRFGGGSAKPNNKNATPKRRSQTSTSDSLQFTSPNTYWRPPVRSNRFAIVRPPFKKQWPIAQASNHPASWLRATPERSFAGWDALLTFARARLWSLPRSRGWTLVVHLAGAGVGDKRWTDEYKTVILRSRVDGHQHDRDRDGRRLHRRTANPGVRFRDRLLRRHR